MSVASTLCNIMVVRVFGGVIFGLKTGFTGAIIQSKAEMSNTLLRDNLTVLLEGVLRDFDVRKAKTPKGMLPIRVATFIPQLRPSSSVFDPDEDDVETCSGHGVRGVSGR
jgi:hypothetical protein